MRAIIIIQRHPIDRSVIEIRARIRPLTSCPVGTPSNAFPGPFLNSSRDPFIYLPSVLSVPAQNRPYHVESANERNRNGELVRHFLDRL